MTMRRWLPGVAVFLAAIFCTVTLAIADNPFPSEKSGHYASNVQYAGGSGTGYSLYQIRWGNHGDFERIVFEFTAASTEWNHILPRMKLETEFYPLRLALRLPGSAPGPAAAVFTSPDPFGKSALISRIDTFDACGGGQHLSIIPARPVEFDVFALTSPPRLVVDIIQSRMQPMRDEKKLSLRTFPLFGDQVCYFLEEAAEAGVTPRLLLDAEGNAFGELGLFDTPDEAFRLRQRLDASLGRNFALIIRARGMMEIPGKVP